MGAYLLGFVCGLAAASWCYSGAAERVAVRVRHGYYVHVAARALLARPGRWHLWAAWLHLRGEACADCGRDEPAGRSPDGKERCDACEGKRQRREAARAVWTESLPWPSDTLWNGVSDGE